MSGRGAPGRLSTRFGAELSRGAHFPLGAAPSLGARSPSFRCGRPSREVLFRPAGALFLGARPIPPRAHFGATTGL